MKTEVEIVPYGEVRSAFPKKHWRTISRHTLPSKSLERTPSSRRCVFVSFSYDLDQSFAELFRTKAAPDTRLLILNAGASPDKLLSRIFDLQIRSPQRCYVVEARFGSGKSYSLGALLGRLLSIVHTDDPQERILDARLENGILRVVSPDFDRLDVPLADIPDFKNAPQSRIERFEIDEDGAFIYWPELDLHLGWRQFQRLVNPEAALKASQKSDEFNKRYGRAVKRIREQERLDQSDISGLSEKQLRRIERGECRLTSKAIESLAKAHKLKPNEYMRKLAEAMDDSSNAGNRKPEPVRPAHGTTKILRASVSSNRR